MELVSIKKLPKQTKLNVLNRLGFEVDNDGFIKKDGKIVTDPYVDIDVKVSNFMIMPGSAIVLDDNPVSVLSYIEEYGDIF